jgi:hypothetical protein
MADESTIVIEFKAKYDEVTKGFNEVSKGSEKVHAETKKMEQGFGELGAKVHEGANSILNEWLGLGIALSGVGLVELFNRTAEGINHITDTAKGLGVSAQDFQALAYGAQLGGVGVDELGGSLKKFNITLGNALEGNQQAIDSFSSLGISVESLRGKSLADQYALVATAAGSLKDKNLAAAESAKIFGREYTSALRLGRDNITENIKEFDKLGATLSDTQREAVKAFDDSKIKLDTIFSGFAQKVVAQASPAFEKLIAGVSDFILASGGIDGVATTVGNKIVDIVQGTIDVFTALKPGFQFLLDTLNTLTVSAKSIFKEAQSFTLSFSDDLSNKTSHYKDPGVSDFLYDAGGGSGKEDGVIDHLKTVFDNILHPFDIAPGAFNNNHLTDTDYPNQKNPSIADKYGSGSNPYANSSAIVAVDAFAKAVEKATPEMGDTGEEIKKLGKSAKASSDAITAAFKTLDDKDKTTELNKVFGLVSANQGGSLPDQPEQTFEKDAAELIQAIKDGNLSAQAYNAGLNNLREDKNYNTAAGFNTKGFDEVIAEIQKYSESLGKQTPQVDLTITVTPSKDFLTSITTTTNKNTFSTIGEIISSAASRSAR